MRHFDARDAIKVLDVGTGPGFFACILSEEGLEVTAIDQSEGVLEKSRENAAKLGVHPASLQMNVNQLDFPNETFDLIVSRNVTWTLQYPEKVYANFKRVLKPGGMLPIYDANWHAHLYDPELMKKVKAREEAHFRKYGTREIVTEDAPEFLATCPMTRYQRPEWDEGVLTDLGFREEIQRDIGRFVYCSFLDHSPSCALTNLCSRPWRRLIKPLSWAELSFPYTSYNSLRIQYKLLRNDRYERSDGGLLADEPRRRRSAVVAS